MRIAHLGPELESCGADRTSAGSVYASSLAFFTTAAHSSRSALEYVSHGWGVNGSGTTQGWWLIQ